MNDINLSSPEYYLEMWENDYANQVQLIDELIGRVGKDTVRQALHEQGLVLRQDLIVESAKVDLEAVRNDDRGWKARNDSFIERVHHIHCPLVRADREHQDITPASPHDIDVLLSGLRR